MTTKHVYVARTYVGPGVGIMVVSDPDVLSAGVTFEDVILQVSLEAKGVFLA
jgi:hypothetical protein